MSSAKIATTMNVDGGGNATLDIPSGVSWSSIDHAHSPPVSEANALAVVLVHGSDADIDTAADHGENFLMSGSRTNDNGEDVMDDGSSYPVPESEE